MQNKMYKVMTSIEKKGGGHYWMRCGSAFRNRDESMNVYLDVIPTKKMEFTIRELDAEDLRKIEASRGAAPVLPIGGASDAAPF